MRRGPLVLAATAAITAALVSFQPSKRPALTVSTGAKTPVASSSRTSSSRTSSSGTSGSGTSGSGTRTVSGAVEQTRYGPVQVRVAVRSGRIADVQLLQVPQDNPRSLQINTYAAPLLRAEALKAQSASIDVVSGATYTSQGYDASLQSALSQAGIA
jgi:uncharacterized protein with FMN-binding domain